jgi:hypothetical protein
MRPTAYYVEPAFGGPASPRITTTERRGVFRRRMRIYVDFTLGDGAKRS